MNDAMDDLDLYDDERKAADEEKEMERSDERDVSDAAPKFGPVFTRDGNEFIIPARNFVADDEESARMIGLGAMLVECILFGMTWTHRVISVSGPLPHTVGRLVGGGLVPLEVAIIAGPMFDDALNNARKTA